jgi:hypothetical protein
MLASQPHSGKPSTLSYEPPAVAHVEPADYAAALGNYLPIVRSLPKIWVVVSLSMEPGEINTGWPSWSSAQPKKGLRDSVDPSKPTTKSLLDAGPTMPDNRKAMRATGVLIEYEVTTADGPMAESGLQLTMGQSAATTGGARAGLQAASV